jgi:hypothetical protein
MNGEENQSETNSRKGAPLAIFADALNQSPTGA